MLNAGLDIVQWGRTSPGSVKITMTGADTAVSQKNNVEHILRECPQLRQLRGRLSVEPDLYGNAEVLHRTAKFLTEALREG